MNAPRMPPPFVPTLTEVIDAPAVPLVTTSPAALEADPDLILSVPQEAPVSFASAPLEEDTEAARVADETQFIDRVQQRVDQVLDLRVRQRLAPVLARVTDDLVQDLRITLNDELRTLVAEVVRQELKGKPPA